ncbi:MAG: hypothetical protein AAB614_02425 [Patescibacteria group bacterium]
MIFKSPKNNSDFSWTNHVFGKMIYYGISEGVIRRVINSPHRREVGIAPETVAVMQKSGTGKNPKEIWVMYCKDGSKKRIITAWRYPGISPVRDEIPIPDDILEMLSSEFNMKI